MVRAPDQQLLNQRILVTRPALQAQTFITELRRLGAYVIAFPTIEVAPPASWAPLDEAIQRLADYDWLVFTSVNGVRFFHERLVALGASLGGPQQRVAAIGPATAGALEALGLTVDRVPDEYVAEAVADVLGDVAGQRVLLPRAAEAREVLTLTLRERGATVDEVAAYQTLPGRLSAASLAEIEGGIDVATFTSSSTVRNFFSLLGEPKAKAILACALVACIGPITARTVTEYGLRVQVIAKDYTTAGLIEAIVQARLSSQEPHDGEGHGLSTRSAGP